MNEFATLFEQARALPEKDRGAFLERACKGDSALREKIERMLSAAAQADAFFGEDSGDDADATLMMAPLPEGPGTVIGRYKLLQKIGEGGMGVVYMAEQTEPVTRKVALKIIKVGMDTRRVIARFEAERQALAMMDHPNIAHVLDGGATESGRPYFVMELVQGVPITEFCDKNKLTARERIDLFIPVCHAIQSAHQKGIIHRDIKPSNVLVTLKEDDQPVPKVIDFGIAKAINQKLTEKTLFTNFATMIGTPAYMSPEQAELRSLDVDTRADVYSLGVLLYELLTGSTPFPEKRLRSVGYGEMQRIIIEEDPQKPSERLRTLTDEEKTTLSKTRGIEGPAFDKLLKGDLDWIVMKCLEKDRRRRYDGPNELAADLKRHLGNEPVSAAAPTFAYQLQKFYQRNRPLAAMAGAIALILLLSTVVSAVLAIRASRSEQARAREAANAKEQAAIAEAVNRFLNEDLLGEADITVKPVLERAAKKMEGRFNNQPRVEAAIRESMASAYWTIGELDSADRHFSQALSLRENTNSDPGKMVAMMWRLSWLFMQRCKTNEAGVTARRAHEYAEKHLPEEHSERLGSLRDLGHFYLTLDDSEGIRYLNEHLELNRRLNGPGHEATVDAALNLISTRWQHGYLKEAEDLLNSIAASGAQKNAALLNQLTFERGRMYLQLDRLADAERIFLKILTSDEKSDDVFWQRDFASLFYASALEGQNKGLEKVFSILEEKVASERAKYGTKKESTLSLMTDLGKYYANHNFLEKAAPLLREAYEISRALDPGRAIRISAADTYAHYFELAGDSARAAELRTEAWADLKKLDSKQYLQSYEIRFSDLVHGAGSEEEAWRFLRQMANAYPNLPHFWSVLASYSGALGKTELHQESLREVLRRSGKATEWSYADRTLRDLALTREGYSLADGTSLSALQTTLTNELAKNSPHWAETSINTSLGLSQYRKGNYSVAISLLERAVSNVPHKIKARAVYSLALAAKALAHFQLGEIEQANALLNEASSFPKNNPHKWHQRDRKSLTPEQLQFVVLRQEAEGLIKGAKAERLSINR